MNNNARHSDIFIIKREKVIFLKVVNIYFNYGNKS